MQLDSQNQLDSYECGTISSIIGPLHESGSPYSGSRQVTKPPLGLQLAFFIINSDIMNACQ